MRENEFQRLVQMKKNLYIFRLQMKQARNAIDIHVLKTTNITVVYNKKANA